MERRLSLEVMDDPAQCEAYIQGDYRASDARFVDRFRARFPSVERGAWLEIGCGFGGLICALCTAWPSIHMVGVDGSGPMLRLAEQRLASTDLTSRVELVERVWTGEPIAGAPFDVLVSRNFLHHLPDPGVMWRALPRLAVAGAPIMVVDIIRPPDDAAAHAMVRRHAAHDPPRLQQDYLEALYGAFTADEVRAQLDAVGLGTHLQVDDDGRYLTVSGRLPDDPVRSQAEHP